MAMIATCPPSKTRREDRAASEAVVAPSPTADPLERRKRLVLAVSFGLGGILLASFAALVALYG